MNIRHPLLSWCTLSLLVPLLASAAPTATKNLAASKPDVLAKLTALATQAHELVRERIFARTDRHERDRRAKFGKQDEPDSPGPKLKAKGSKARQ